MAIGIKFQEYGVTFKVFSLTYVKSFDNKLLFELFNGNIKCINLKIALAKSSAFLFVCLVNEVMR